MKSSHQPKVVTRVQEKQPLLLDCPQCHSFISADNINVQKKIAKCDHCDHVFNYEEDGYWDPFGPPFETHPAGIEVLKLSSLLELRVTHYLNADRTGLATVMFFSLIWNIALLPFIFFIISSGQLYILLFISLHLFAGVSMLWDVFGKIFNRSIIEINRKTLQVQTRPFPWPGQRHQSIKTSHIDQLFVDKSRTNKTPRSGQNYSLKVRLNSGKKRTLISGLDKKTLLYLESQIEDYLGIKDQRIL